VRNITNINGSLRGSQLYRSDSYYVVLIRLSKIRFVPVEVPVDMEIGGYLRSEPDVQRFEQVLSPSAGPLGFTVFPVLEEGLEMHQVR